MVIKFIKENIVFACIFLVAAVIRFIPAFRYQYSYDELCGLSNSIFTNWHDLINYGVKLDTHPILVQLIINFTVKCFGYGEFWVKLPFLLFSLTAIVYAYLFSLKWYNKTAALITASIFSFSYIFLFYAPLARMYAGGLFFSTALTYYLFEICLTDSKKTKHYVLFVLFIILCALNNHLSCLYAFTCSGIGLFFQNKSTIAKYLIACVCAVVLYLPHWSITMAQFAQGGIGHEQDGWLAAPDKWVLLGFLKTLFGTGQVWMLFLLLIGIAFAMMKEMRVNKKTMILLFLFFANYSIIYTYSICKAPIFQYSVMLFSAPCFIWAVTGIFKFKGKISIVIVGICSAVLIYQSIIQKHFFTNAVLNQNGFQSKKYCQLEDKYGAGKVEAFFMGSQRYFVIEHELKYKRRFNYFVVGDFKTVSAFRKHLKESKAEYLLLGEPTCTQLEIAKEYFPFLQHHAQSLNVNCYLFSKSKSETTGTFDESRDISSFVNAGKYKYTVSKEKFEGYLYRVDSTDEFCYSAQVDLKNLDLKEGNVIHAKLKVKSAEELNEVELDYKIVNQRDSTLFFGGTELSRFYISDSSGYYVYSDIFIGSEYKKWLRQDAKVTFFIWNRSLKKFKFNNFEIKTIDYWPERWAWWD